MYPSQKAAHLQRTNHGCVKVSFHLEDLPKRQGGGGRVGNVAGTGVENCHRSQGSL